MDHATPQTVLGDFNNAEFKHFDLVSKFEREGDKFFVTTDNARGDLERFEVRYTFGVKPLQQYLVEFPDGRVQALSIAWDTEQKRWFDLHPEERIKSDDELHWTRPAQNWNYMCAECHSTNVQKHFDLKTNTYRTTFSEIDVSCETCHGAGSLHVDLARKKSLFWDRRYGYGLARLKDPSNQTEIETCARCHARRRVVHGDFQGGEKMLDFYQPSLLEPGLYHVDGQILDEVYEYGSFTQSRMYRENVRCTDCHEPHSLRLRFEGNQLCLRCHTLAKGNYDSPAHHYHPLGGRGTKCVECHMPTKTYMVVDPRRDHSLRVPRPDLSIKLGTPNACQPCHTDHDDRWAADKVIEWYGPNRKQNPHYGEAFAAAMTGRPSAEQLLLDFAKPKNTTDRAKLVSGTVRATAVQWLAELDGSGSRDYLATALTDDDPLVRAAAVQSFDTATPDEDEQRRLRDLLVPRLQDPVRLVRTEAVKILSRVPQRMFTGEESARFAAVLTELKAGLQETADDAGAHLALGTVAFNLGNLAEARTEFRDAIQTARNQMQAGQSRLQLAQIEHASGDSAASEKLYREVIALEPRYDPAHYQLGLLLAEDEKRLADAATALGQAAKLAPRNARYQYNYGLALQKLGRNGEAEVALDGAVQLDPQSPEFLMALTILYAQLEDWKNAVPRVQQLMQMSPTPEVRQLYSNIMRFSRGRKAP
jgi:predicted CXXCH cytochrome family protein